MPCQKFTTLTDQFSEMPSWYGSGDVAFCDRWLFDAVNHALLLRRRYQTASGVCYQSQFADSDWEEVVEATHETPIAIRIRIMLQNWPGALIGELQDLEAKVAH
jgi:hypothetical protein